MRDSLAHHHQRIGLADLGGKRRAQGPGRQAQAVAGADLRIHQSQRQILGQRRVLEAIVHQNEACLQRGSEGCAFRPVGGNDRGSGGRQQKRLVAYIGAAVFLRVHQHRALQPPAIAAQQEDRLVSLGLEQGAEFQGKGRLARPAHDKVADTDDRQAGMGRWRLVHAPARDRAINEGERRKQRGLQVDPVTPPEGWSRSHSPEIPSLAPLSA